MALAEDIGRRAATEHVRPYEAVRNSEAEAREADRRKDEFIAMWGHELRNPLMPIQLALDVIHHGAVEPEQVAKYDGAMARQTKALARLVDDLLEVSRVIRGNGAAPLTMTILEP